jgi:hypothetical protein
MFLPRRVYEVVPYAYLLLGAGLALGSWLRPEAAWADVALVVGIAGVVVGLVLLMRRRSYRADARHYDPRSLDDA